MCGQETCGCEMWRLSRADFHDEWTSKDSNWCKVSMSGHAESRFVAALDIKRVTCMQSDGNHES